jgi:glutathione S-transferase
MFRLTDIQQKDVTMTKITIHGFAASTFVRTARMAAIELGFDHDLQPLEFRAESHLKLHPFAKMPILTDGAETIYETLAILAYLDEKAGLDNLFPVTGAGRWRCFAACSVALDYAYQPVVHGEDDAANEDAVRVLNWADGWLGASDWLTGTKIGAADHLLVPMIAHRLSKYPQDTVFGDRPALARWFGETAKRDSFVRTAA